MARKNVTKAVELFLSGQCGKGSSTGTIRSAGDVLYSYNLPIAARMQQACGTWRFFVLDSDWSPSKTTTTHLNQVRTEMKLSTIETFSTITEVSLDDLKHAIKGGECLEEVIIRNEDVAIRNFL
jgi:hypothetical protein